jgi:hypothetical protein
MRTARMLALIVWASLLTLGMAIPASAAAAGPERFQFTEDYADIGISCDGFDIFIEGTLTRKFTVFTDKQGEVTTVVEHASAPHDVLTNTVSGKSIVVRAHFAHFDERVPGTDTFTREITGFRYFVNSAGEGVVLRDVGRIVYTSREQQEVLFSAGSHPLAFEADVEAALCEALA